MSFLKNTVSLLAVFSIIPAAVAATARPSVLNTATAVSATGNVRRMPTMTSYMNGTSGSGTTGSAGSSVLLDNLECIEAYTDCIKSDDACGSDMSECTTNVLFHGKMPQCVSTLAQCESAGVNSLFGTTNVLALSDYTSANVNKYGEVTRYTYPTDGSILGQMIISAAVENQYDTQTCVKRYTSCLQKDTVCGGDFELCTSEKDFKRQALMCDSTLARCSGAAREELLGDADWTPKSGKGIGGRVEMLIEQGAELASLNAVSTCYNVIDRCFAGACGANPLRCVAGTALDTVLKADAVSGDDLKSDFGQTKLATFDDNEYLVDSKTGKTTDTLNPNYGDLVAGEITVSDVNAYLRGQCMDAIGANKYCFMTFMERTPTNKQLADVENQEIVFEEAMDQRKKYLDSKIAGLMQEFTEQAKDKCSDTITSCAMRACGGGLGSVCYSQVFETGITKTAPASIGTNNTISANEVKAGCKAVVDNDVNCKYIASSLGDNTFQTDDLFTLSGTKIGAFDKLFTSDDPINVVAKLDATLSTSYNAAAIEKMRNQCYASATSCVKSMCGTDYQNCYRNRTDIYSTLTKTGDAMFDNSMNKVSGVLDHTVILGLCVNTVKDSEACKEHLAITAARYKTDNGYDSKYSDHWGNSQTTVRDSWIDAGSSRSVNDVLCEYVMHDSEGNELCTNADGIQGICGRFTDDGKEFKNKICQSSGAYHSTLAANSLFSEVLANLELEAQAKYNAKLTREQNVCLAQNAGGMVYANSGSRGSTYRWVQLKSKNVIEPETYVNSGLTDDSIKDSNDLYGSFCAIRVSLQSSDPVVQKWISDNSSVAVRYFAAGDGFSCGSWIPVGEYPAGGCKITKSVIDCPGIDSGSLMGLAYKVAQDSYTVDKKTSDTVLQTVLPAVGAIGSAVGGSFLGEKLWEGTAKSNGKEKSAGVTTCKSKLDNVSSALKNVKNEGDTFETVKKLWTNNKYEKSDIEDVIPDGINKATKAQKANETKDGQTEDAYYCGNGDEKQSATTVCWGDQTLADVKAKVADVINGKKLECGEEKEFGETTVDKKGAQIAGGILTAAAGGTLVFGVTRAAIDANRSAEQQAVMDEFMNTLGNKINCVVGNQVVGTYGAFVETAIE